MSSSARAGPHGVFGHLWELLDGRVEAPPVRDASRVPPLTLSASSATLLTSGAEPRRQDARVRLTAWEADLVERTLPAGPAPPALVAVSVLANGSRLWLGIAAVLALRPALRPAAVDGVLAIVLAAGATQAVARVVDRPRPPADHPARPRGTRPTSSSFPSSHTSVGVAFTTAVTARNPRLGAALAPLAATLAYGRVRLRVHWPTDVLGGALLGVAAGRAVALSSRRVWSRPSR